MQLSSLLGCPEPIPTVDLSLTITIEFDFVNLQILKANTKFSNCDLLGFLFETTLKSFLENICLSSDCNKKKLLMELNLKNSFKEKLEHLSILNFFDLKF